jgi:RNA polymerase sigma-70 factor (ECF subfamily)
MSEVTITEAQSIRVESFESFYRDRWSEIHRAVAVGLSDSDLSREAVDEAMVRAFERWDQVSQMSNPSGWVYRVAMNWARSRLRRRSLLPWTKRPVGVIEDTHDLIDPSTVAALQQLPLLQREVVVARLLLDMSEVGAAEALGVPRGTVKSRLSRALKNLRKELT